MKKKVKVIMLPSNSKSAYSGQIVKGAGGFLFTSRAAEDVGTLTPQHLYLVSDDEIKDGDFVIPREPNNSVWKYHTPPCPLPYWGNPNNCFKIIATTDPSLNLPLISDYFIKEYVAKEGKIDEVYVEYINNKLVLYGGKEFSKDFHKVVITPIKDSYTREEVIKLCQKAYFAGTMTSYPKDNNEAFAEFVEENL